jgi:plastocyanin
MPEVNLGHRGRLLAQLTAAAAVAALVLGVGTGSGLAADPTVEVTGNSLATYAWTPSSAEAAPGGSVTFKNTTANPHALSWESAPVTPSCTGTPSVGQANWSGSCTFPQAGTYKFYCPVHPAQMKGTITVPGTPAPVVTTGAATAVGETAATVSGTVKPSGSATTYYFEYGMTTGYGQKTTEEPAGKGSTAVSQAAELSGLLAATTYHFRIVAVSDGGTTQGADRTFTTTGPPAASTESATKVGGTEATLTGSANPHGVATTYFFNYGPTAAYGQKTTETSAGSGTAAVPVSVPVTGLTPETTYHFQLVAKSAAGTVTGVDKTFTTLGAPLATTGAASSIGEDAATLQGTVNPQGQQTTYLFRYGTTSAYGQETAAQLAGKGLSNVPATAAVNGLSAGTTYHFQLVAQNASGTTTGSDQTFTTSTTTPSTPSPPDLGPPPLTPAPPAPPPPAPPAPPDTKLTSNPPAKTKDRTPTVKFTATAVGATYRCSVDGKPFKTCRSPFTSPSLKPGRHTIRVAALAGGATDPTPASCSFKVVAKRKARR